jgi:hypothetical protein
VSYWHDIVAISAGKLQTVGLKADGTVITVGDGSYEQYKARDWNLFEE